MSNYSDDDDYYEDGSEMEEEEEDEEDEEPEWNDKVGSGKKRGRSKSESGGRGGSKKKSSECRFLEIEAEVTDDDEEDEDVYEEDDFFVNGETDIPAEDDQRQFYRRRFNPLEDVEEDVENFEKRYMERYSRLYARDDDELEEHNEVDQQALLPSVRDPKLWMVKCAIGREREVAVCLMQKIIDRGFEFKIRSVIALDHLQNYVYIEADLEAHVKEAIKGMRNIYANNKILLVPIKEMTDVLNVESKAIDISRGMWVRMKLGIYKGDLAQVVDVDNVRRRVTVKLIPRIDLQVLANKLEGKETVKKKAFAPPPRFMNVDEARELRIRVEHRRDPMTGDYFESIDGMLFKNGFLYKKVSTKSIASQNITPTFDELERFKRPSENREIDFDDLSTLFANRKKGHFMKGDAVIVIKGDLKNLKGWIEKVDEENVLIRSNIKGLPNPLAVNERDLCKYFEPGNFVKVVSGTHEGATGMVVKVDQHVLIILSDTTKEHIRIFADHVVKSTEVTNGVTKMGDYELHDLVLLNDLSFGVIIKLESEAIQILKGVPDRPEVSVVKAREIKYKIQNKRTNAQDRHKNVITVKDVVRVIEGSNKGKQGPVVQINKGVLFIHDRLNLEHTGYICTKCSSCVLVGGSYSGANRIVDSFSRFGNFKTPAPVPPSPRRFQRADMGSNFGAGAGRGHWGGRGGRGNGLLVGTYVKIRLGPFKGYMGPLVEVKEKSVRVQLEAKIVTVDRNAIADMNDNVATPSQYNVGSQTPMHPPRTPLHPCMTPMRDSGVTPILDGMRTPMRNRAWNPYTPMTPARDNWENGNPRSLGSLGSWGSWGTSSQNQPESLYDPATHGSGWSSSPPGRSYSDAGKPIATAQSLVTPSSVSYQPTTTGGQPMTPRADLDDQSPDIGENGETWLMSGILVNVHKAGEASKAGVIRDVLPDGSCVVALGNRGEGDSVKVTQSEVRLVCPSKNDHVKIVGGKCRGSTAKLIGFDGSDSLVRLDDSLDIKIMKPAMLAKLVHE